MYFTAQFKKSASALTFNQIILAFVLLIVLVGQVSALPKRIFQIVKVYGMQVKLYSRK